MRCPTTAAEMKAARYLNWRINRRVNAEDTELITRVQQGMQSASYTPGRSATSEVCLRSFAAKLRRLIPEARLAQAPAAGLERLATAHEQIDRHAHGEQRHAPQVALEPAPQKAKRAEGEAGHCEQAADDASLSAAIAAAT